MTTARCEGVVELAIVLSRMAPFCTHVGTFLVSGGTSGWGPDGCHPSLSQIHNALAFLVERTMHEMARDGREHELKALLTDLFGERAAAAAVERLHARMGADGLDSP